MALVNAALTLTAVTLAPSNPMIIACPSCATQYDLPPSRFAAEGTMINCSACRHSWIEGHAVEVKTVSPRSLPVVMEQAFEPDQDVRRIMEASREARERFAMKRRQRRQRLRGWAALAAALALPVMLAAIFPETVVRAAPSAIGAYKALGWSVNVYGLDLRRIEIQHLLDKGTRVLAVKGEIANISGGDRKIPWLRFGLDDGGGSELYRWTLDSGARPLRPGEITTFVTRIASPPDGARTVQIRFAHADEIGLNAAP